MEVKLDYNWASSRGSFVSGGATIFLLGGCLKANLFDCNSERSACLEAAWAMATKKKIVMADIESV